MDLRISRCQLLIFEFGNERPDDTTQEVICVPKDSLSGRWALSSIKFTGRKPKSRTLMWWIRVAVGLSLAWLSLDMQHAQAAIVCPNTGMVSPVVPTLVVSPDDPTESAWIVGPDCDREIVRSNRIGVSSSAMEMQIRGGGIERVVGLPRIESVSIMGNPLSQGADFTNVTSALEISRFSQKLLKNIVFPRFENGGQVSLTDSPLTSLRGVTLPEPTGSLYFSEIPLKTLAGMILPATLISLIVEKSKLTAIDLDFPPNLRQLFVSKAALASIENIVFPDSIQILKFADNQIAVVKGVTWPFQLMTLDLGGNSLVDFEIRESDVALFKQLGAFYGDFSRVQCSDAMATLTEVNSKNVCVISDDRFEYLYRRNTPSPAVNPGSTPKPKSSKKPTASANESSLPDDQSSLGTDASSDPNGDETKQDAPTTTGSRSENTTTSGPVPIPTATPSGTRLTPSVSPPTSKTTVTQTLTATNSTLPVIFAVLSVLVVVIVVVWIYRSRGISKQPRGHEGTPVGKDHSQDTPGTSSYHDFVVPQSNESSREYLLNDIRNDKVMLQFRINQKEVMLSKQIARGGYGVIHRATYQGRDVAIKQMLPGSWQNERELASFIDEIRVCASLNHPKVVTFVGIAYSSLRDLSVVIEFMPGGDLHALLQKQQEELRSSQEWFEPWTSSQIKCKASIGQDIAEAIAYLHALETPIIHRDLKARNVLLDIKGNAKLSDFGISRELTIDETMTSEVGTAAWIAPEVLRGARYTEKADIYSLGVLLVELDRCKHPYADEPMLQHETGHNLGSSALEISSMSHLTQKNTQIAVLVSIGKLRPSVSRECPDQVGSLVAACLSFNPTDRPSAKEVADLLSRFG